MLLANVPELMAENIALKQNNKLLLLNIKSRCYFSNEKLNYEQMQLFDNQLSTKGLQLVVRRTKK